MLWCFAVLKTVAGVALVVAPVALWHALGLSGLGPWFIWLLRNIGALALGVAWLAWRSARDPEHSRTMVTWLAAVLAALAVTSALTILTTPDRSVFHPFRERAAALEQDGLPRRAVGAAVLAAAARGITMGVSAVTADEAIAKVRNGMRIFLHGAASTPFALLDALCRRRELEGVELYHLHINGTAPFLDHPGLHSNSLFCGGNVRQAVNEGRADYVPVFLSDIPWLFTSRKVALDVALISLSSPDRHGFCTLGPSVDAARAAVDSAGLVIAEVNRRMPRTHGDTAVPLSKVSACVETDRLPAATPRREPGPVEMTIGEQVAALVADGSTLQLGHRQHFRTPWRTPSPRARRPWHPRQMFSDGIVDLVEAGAVTGRCKTVHPHRIVTSFVSGTQRVYDFVDDNATVSFHSCDETNDTATIRRHDRMVAINSAIKIDLTGQVCADGIGQEIFSGIGGQMDFIRGAALSRGGKPIIALPSTACRGRTSRIVPLLKPGPASSPHAGTSTGWSPSTVPSTCTVCPCGSAGRR